MGRGISLASGADGLTLRRARRQRIATPPEKKPRIAAGLAIVAVNIS